MKKLLFILSLFVATNLSAQKKDTLPTLDTLFVLSVSEATYLKQILMESKVIVNGEQLSGKQLQALFTWIDQKARVFKKEQPKN